MGVIFNIDTGSASCGEVVGIFGLQGTSLKGANVGGMEKLGTVGGVARLGTEERNVTAWLNRRTIAREIRARFENMPFATEGGTASSCSAAHHSETSGGSDGSGLSGSTGISEPRIAATASARLDSTALPKASRCSISPQTEHWKVWRLNPETRRVSSPTSSFKRISAPHAKHRIALPHSHRQPLLERCNDGASRRGQIFHTISFMALRAGFPARLVEIAACPHSLQSSGLMNNARRPAAILSVHSDILAGQHERYRCCHDPSPPTSAN
jgi:hypothetical protein